MVKAKIRLHVAGIVTCGSVVLTSVLASPGTAYSAAPSQLANLQAELKIAAAQTQLATPLNPNPSLGLEANYGPNTMNWKCNPVRSVSSEPLCVLGDAKATRTLVLWGDSQINQWGPSFDLWGKATSWRIIDLHKGDCPPWPSTINLWFDYTPYPECGAFRTFALNIIKQLHPAVVIPLGLRTRWARGAGVRNGPDQAAFTSEISALIAQLKPLTGRVVLMQQMPHWSSDFAYAPAPDCIVMHASNLSPCMGQFNSNLLDPLMNGSLVAAGAKAGVSVLNIQPLFCTPTLCPQVSGRTVIYADSYHFTRVWGQHIEPALSEILASINLGK